MCVITSCACACVVVPRIVLWLLRVAEMVEGTGGQHNKIDADSATSMVGEQDRRELVRVRRMRVLVCSWRSAPLPHMHARMHAHTHTTQRICPFPARCAIPPHLKPPPTPTRRTGFACPPSPRDGAGRTVEGEREGRAGTTSTDFDLGRSQSDPRDTQ